MSDPDANVIQKNKTYKSVVGAIGALAAVIIVTWALLKDAYLSWVLETQPLMITIILILGVAFLIALLNVAAAIFSSLGLADPNEALSLPKGSVRALIALMLIIIFALTSIFLYDNLNTERVSEFSVRFANQILTTTSTLVVAVAGFYFGTKAVQTAQATPLEGDPLEILKRRYANGEISKEQYTAIKTELE